MPDARSACAWDGRMQRVEVQELVLRRARRTQRATAGLVRFPVHTGSVTSAKPNAPGLASTWSNTENVSTRSIFSAPDASNGAAPRPARCHTANSMRSRLRHRRSVRDFFRGLAEVGDVQHQQVLRAMCREPADDRHFIGHRGRYVRLLLCRRQRRVVGNIEHVIRTDPDGVECAGLRRRNLRQELPIL